jgi:ABC-type glutathione transport system ATPase component
MRYPRRKHEHAAEVPLAVTGVSFRIAPGESVGMVGESGSGKTTTAYCVARLLEPTGGAVRFMGTDITHLRGNTLRMSRRQMQMVFQDPFSSLNPRMYIEQIVEEPLRAYQVGDRAARRTSVRDLLDSVGLDPRFARRYPRELSGGQRQRVCIARALAISPQLLICDEPVSALDVSMQAQIINLLKDLQRDLGLAYLFISHDLAVVRSICDRVVVMHDGEIIEQGDCAAIYESPTHPYTKKLLDSARVRTRSGADYDGVA